MHMKELLHTKYLLTAAEQLWALIYSRSVSQGLPTGVAAALRENLITADLHQFKTSFLER